MLERPQITRLDETSWLSLYQVFDESEAQLWMTNLIAESAFEERSIVLFGKKVLQPRLIGWAGEGAYTYSKQTLVPRRMGPALRKLMELTRSITNHQFNHALLNLYRDGRDSMGMHSDDEPELGVLPRVASWSMGTKRRFVLAEKRGKQRVQLELPSGSLLVMEGATQAHFRHGLPKDKSSEPRLNVTFRKIVEKIGSQNDG